MAEMNTYRRSGTGECPSWERLARHVEEGGLELQEHVRDCPQCGAGYRLILGLYGVADGKSSASSVECPGVRDWIALSSERIEAGHRYELSEHLASCDSCARLFRYVLDAGESGELEWDLRDAPPPMEAAAFELRVGSGRRLSGFLARAAAVVLGSSILIAVATGAFPRIGVGSDERWRGPSPTMSASAERDIESANLTVRWEAWPDATSYRVRIWDRVGNVVIDRSLAPDAQMLELALDRVPPGTVLIWQVEALRRGAVIAKAPPARLVWNGR